MHKTFAEVKSALASGSSIEDIVRGYLNVIQQNNDLNAFLEVFETTAITQAKAIDEKIASKTAGRLAGMVIGIKDNLCYKNHKVTAASKILEGFESLYTATAVERLINEDAVIIGRLNCDEFAMGSSNENSAYGPVKNNLNKSLVPGGSSGGSAVAVSAGLCTAALGSDTGGSIRQPASFTGTYGLKPTYGRISRYGLIAYASSFDQIGPFTNSLSDSALLLEVMAGPDEYDSTATSRPIEKYSEFSSVKQLKIAVLKESLTADGVDEEIKNTIKNQITLLKTAGHQVDEVSFPYLEYMVPTYYVLTTAESSSNLSRFDGVHFGYRHPEAKGVEDTYKKSRSVGFGPEVQRRIMAGTFVLSHGFYDAYYTKGQKVRRVLRNKTDEILSQYAAIILPTTPSTAFALDSFKDPIQMYLQDIFTVHANLTGNPALSLPLGRHSNGLPFGIQLVGNHFAEKELFDIANVLVNNTLSS